MLALADGAVLFAMAKLFGLVALLADGGTWHETLILRPGEERRCDIPVGDGPGTPLTVHSAQGFRPADLDPKSQDDRVLGVWIATL